MDQGLFYTTDVLPTTDVISREISVSSLDQLIPGLDETLFGPGQAAISVS